MLSPTSVFKVMNLRHRRFCIETFANLPEYKIFSNTYKNLPRDAKSPNNRYINPLMTIFSYPCVSECVSLKEKEGREFSSMENNSRTNMEEERILYELFVPYEWSEQASSSNTDFECTVCY